MLGAAALASPLAPTIVRSGVLMPVSVAAIPDPLDLLPMSRITPSMIAREALVILQENLRTARRIARAYQTVRPSQLCVDSEIGHTDLLMMPFGEFRERHLRPAMACLGSAIPSNGELSGVERLLPQGVDFAANASRHGESLRVIRAYNISTDSFVTRFDVGVE